MDRVEIERLIITSDSVKQLRFLTLHLKAQPNKELTQALENVKKEINTLSMLTIQQLLRDKHSLVKGLKKMKVARGAIKDNG
jgi:hypothetical protein